MVIFQECICCHELDKELYTAARYACHRTQPAAQHPMHNKLCKTCATDRENHPYEKRVNNNCIDYCRIHGKHLGCEDSA